MLCHLGYNNWLQRFEWDHLILQWDLWFGWKKKKRHNMYIYQSPNRPPQNWDFFSYISDRDYHIRLLCSIPNKWLELEPTRQKWFKNPETHIWNPAYVLSRSLVLGTMSNALLWQPCRGVAVTPSVQWGDGLCQQQESDETSQLVLGKASAKPGAFEWKAQCQTWYCTLVIPLLVRQRQGDEKSRSASAT